MLAGALDVTTAGSVDVARDAAELGVDGLFVFPAIGAQDVAVAWDADNYPEVMSDMFRAIAAEVDLPMVVHPVATPVDPLRHRPLGLRDHDTFASRSRTSSAGR